ncbi:hypothetical protein GCM10009795_020980 [Nocardioides hankookensis]|uniref:Uncharacterized protein n=1 Tax=Nocardioides hankookensis TaxID=443157 RepID=A0ABW1LLD8_9ACTN
MTSSPRSIARRLLTTAAALTLGGSLALVDTAPAHATAYDTIVIKDRKNDTGYEPDYHFPDVIRTTYQHVGTGKDATLRVLVQLRKDVRWNRLDQLSFDANRTQVHVYDANDRGHYVLALWPRAPHGNERVCRVCGLKLNKDKRNVLMTIPYSKLGQPSSIKLGVLYIAQGLVQDRVAKPSRPLY